jgi:hypothetical protein
MTFATICGSRVTCHLIIDFEENVETTIVNMACEPEKEPTAA